MPRTICEGRKIKAIEQLDAVEVLGQLVVRDAGVTLAIDVADEGPGPPEPDAIFRSRKRSAMIAAESRPWSSSRQQTRNTPGRLRSVSRAAVEEGETMTAPASA